MTLLRRYSPGAFLFGCIAICVALCPAMIPPANAQFKVVGPAPYTNPVARQKVAALLQDVNAGNRRETTNTLTGLLSWYRDIIDEELIAAWQKGGSADLAEVTKSLADSRVASSVVEVSWRQQREAAFQLANAPMFTDLMTRFPESGRFFLSDLLTNAPDLSKSEAEAVCRIILDLPDIRISRKDALKILPHYRQSADKLVARDLAGDDEDKRDHARFWQYDLKNPGSDAAVEDSTPQTRPRSAASSTDRSRLNNRPTLAEAPPGVVGLNGPPTASAPVRRPPPDPVAAPVNAPPAQTIASAPFPPIPAPAPVVEGKPALQTTPRYEGPMSGTLECTGGPVAQNAEYVFRNLPAVKIQLDYDNKIWEARLSPGDAQSQRLVLKNKSSGPQKRCVVHWSVIP